MKYVLLTITDETQTIRKWDWLLANDNSHYRDTESFYNGSSITTMVFSDDEIKGFDNMVGLLARSLDTENIDILSHTNYGGINKWK